jgi:hypothetical protein
MFEGSIGLIINHSQERYELLSSAYRVKMAGLDLRFRNQVERMAGKSRSEKTAGSC